MQLHRFQHLSKESLDLLLSNMAEGIMVVNQDYRIEYMNRSLHSHFGNQTGKKCYKTISHQNYPCHLCPVREIIKKHHRYFDTTIRDQRGEIYEIEAFPIRDVDGNKKVVEIVRDITENYTTSAKLLEKEQFLANITRYSRDAIVAVTSRGRFSFWNKGAEELFGYTIKEMVGQSISKLVLQGKREGFKELGEKIIKRGSIKNYLAEAIRKDGKVIPINITASTIKDARHRVEGFAGIIVDISEMRKYEEAIEKEREKLENIFEGSGDGISIISRDYRIQYINRFMRKAFTTEVLGKHCYLAYNGLRKVCPWCPVKKTFETGKNAIDIAKDKFDEYWEIKTSPMKNEKGEITSVIEICRNVSRRIRMEKEITRYQHIVENSFDSIMVVGLNRKIIYANPVTIRLLGYDSEKELIGKHDSILGRGYRDEIPLNPPFAKGEVRGVRKKTSDNQSTKEDLSTKVTQVVNKEGRWIGEAVLKKKDGNFIDVLLSDSILKYQEGKPYGHVIIIHDITKRKKREEQIAYLASIVRDSQEPIFTINMSGTIVSWNNACTQLSGYSFNEIMNTLIGEYVPNIQEQIDITLKEEKCVGKEIEIRAKDKELIPINLSTFLLRNQKNEVIGIAGFIEDIREKKLLQTKLNQAERLASIGRFAAGVAHEINNPLGSVLGFAQILLSNEKIDSEAKIELKKIEKEINRCVKIIENLLYFAQPKETVKVNYNINNLLDNTLFLVSNHLENKQIIIEKHFTKNIPKIMVDCGQIQQAFTNIILNACRAMSSQGLLKIMTEWEKSDGEKIVKVSFIDNGCGIPPENLSKIFDPFFTTTYDYGKAEWKGIGLGLSVSYRIIQAHNGTIEVQSQPHIGSTFTVKLPVQ